VSNNGVSYIICLQIKVFIYRDVFETFRYTNFVITKSSEGVFVN